MKGKEKKQESIESIVFGVERDDEGVFTKDDVKIAKKFLMEHSGDLAKAFSSTLKEVIRLGAEAQKAHGKKVSTVVVQTALESGISMMVTMAYGENAPNVIDSISNSTKELIEAKKRSERDE